jgi:hypothetical protein
MQAPGAPTVGAGDPEVECLGPRRGDPVRIGEEIIPGGAGWLGSSAASHQTEWRPRRGARRARPSRHPVRPAIGRLVRLSFDRDVDRWSGLLYGNPIRRVGTAHDRGWASAHPTQASETALGLAILRRHRLLCGRPSPTRADNTAGLPTRLASPGGSAFPDRLPGPRRTQGGAETGGRLRRFGLRHAAIMGPEGRDVKVFSPALAEKLVSPVPSEGSGLKLGRRHDDAVVHPPTSGPCRSHPRRSGR